jgi:hypothetical protein
MSFYGTAEELVAHSKWMETQPPPTKKQKVVEHVEEQQVEEQAASLIAARIVAVRAMVLAARRGAARGRGACAADDQQEDEEEQVEEKGEEKEKIKAESVKVEKKVKDTYDTYAAKPDAATATATATATDADANAAAATDATDTTESLGKILYYRTSGGLDARNDINERLADQGYIYLDCTGGQAAFYEHVNGDADAFAVAVKAVASDLGHHVCEIYHMPDPGMGLCFTRADLRHADNVPHVSIFHECDEHEGGGFPPMM